VVARAGALRIAAVGSAVVDHPRVVEPVEAVVAAMGAVPRDAVTMVVALRVVVDPAVKAVVTMAVEPRVEVMIVADRKVVEPVEAVVAVMVVVPRAGVLRIAAVGLAVVDPRGAATMGVELKAVKPRDAVLKVVATMGVKLKAVVVRDGVAQVLNKVVVDHLAADSFSF
jgi:hypothetical protein